MEATIKYPEILPDLGYIKALGRSYTGGIKSANDKIRAKIVHTEKVLENGMGILERVYPGLEHRWKVTVLLALVYHDAGRFPQVSLFNSFEDSQTVIHADLSLVELRQSGTYDWHGLDGDQVEALEAAVAYHSHFKLPNDLSESELLVAHILQDADKISIIDANLIEAEAGEYVFLPHDFDLSDLRYTESILERLVRREDFLKSEIVYDRDILLHRLSWLYDLHFRETREITVHDIGAFERIACLLSGDGELLDRLEGFAIDLGIRGQYVSESAYQ